MKRLALIFLILFAGCSSYSIKGADGSTISGSLLNGAASYSSGAACTPAQPNPATPIPQQPAAFASKLVCDPNGENCKSVMMSDVAQPQCVTQIVNVRGTDISSYFAWLFAAGAAAVVGVAAGS